MTTTEIPQRGENPVRDRILAAVERLLPAQIDDPMTFDEVRGAWTVRCRPFRHVAPVPLQHNSLAADITERGALLLPVGRSGRFAVDVRFATEAGVLAPAMFAVHPDRVEIDLVGKDAFVRVAVSIDEDGIAWTPRIIAGAPQRLYPMLVWTPRSSGERAVTASGLLPAQSLDVVDELATQSNSRLPDPLPPHDLPAGEPVVHVEGARLDAEGPIPEVGPLLAERNAPDGSIVTALPGWPADALGRVRITCLAAPSAIPLDPFSPPRVQLKLAELDRQLAFSAQTAVSSAVRRADGHTIQLHGRRDRAMGDVAHLHQSHQMHYVALAGGATKRVREELLLASSLQSRSGEVSRSPGVGAESYPYVPGFTEVHLLEGAHRYVAWTGDDGILQEHIVASDGSSRIFRDRLVAAAHSMLARGREGLLAPCGWLDAWNPAVRAQGQVSMEGAAALESLVELLHAGGLDDEGLAEAARALRQRIDEVFLDPATGLYAEHLFDDGRVTGGALDDFWAHTQVSAVLAAQTADPRGLDLIRRYCRTTGITGLAPATLDQPYVADSTDDEVSLELDSTATWMLAAWPELTHRYALAEFRLKRPDHAVDVIHGMLPERLHRRRARVAPWYYAEKYLYPGDRPWLFTWGGDPTLVEAVLSGLFGLRVDLTGVHATPSLPENAAPATAEFTYRGRRTTLTVTPNEHARFSWEGR
jgi:hypothetical protein